MNILNEIVTKQRSLLTKIMRERPLRAWENNIKPRARALSACLRKRDWSLIAECKTASPVKGPLCRDKTIEDLALIYEANGAAALSVHTNEYFAGRLADLGKIRRITGLPILRKEFVIHPYQVYETADAGADALLLIARLLAPKELAALLAEADALGLDCLVEAHDAADVENSLTAGARIIGINNRDLTDFTTDITVTLRLKELCGDRPVVSESGFKEKKDALLVKAAGVRGALVGEGLSAAADTAAKTRELALLEEDEHDR